jgi:uncharacterized protein DUF4013
LSPAHALAYPLRRGAGRAWLFGLPLLLLFPLTFVLVFGYALQATRASLADPASPPPQLRLDGRLLREGALTSALVAALTLPFAALAWMGGGAMSNVLHATGDAFFNRAYGLLAAGLLIAIPWGLLLLLLLPPNVAAYCVSGRLRDLLDPVLAFRRVSERFLDWNLATVAMVTGWLLGFAAVGLLCVGFLPGAFYAILVSAHATASLAPRTSSPCPG